MISYNMRSFGTLDRQFLTGLCKLYNLYLNSVYPFINIDNPEDYYLYTKDLYKSCPPIMDQLIDVICRHVQLIFLYNY